MSRSIRTTAERRTHGGSRGASRSTSAGGTSLTRASKSVALGGAVLVLAVCAVYGPGLAGPFLFDDHTAIVNNPTIRSLSPLSGPLTPPRDTPVAGRPLVNLTLALTYAYSGLDVAAYHAGNIAIHALAGLVLFGLARRTLRLPALAPRVGDMADGAAWAIALLWTLHPLQSEVVNYLTQRTESLMGLCALLTLYAVVRALAPTGRARWQAIAVAACAAGMACKESMVTLPLVVPLLDGLVLFGSWREAWQARWRLYAGLAATWIVLAALLAGSPRSTAGFGTDIAPLTYLLNQARIVARYLRLVVWPSSLVLDYGLPLPLGLSDVLLPGLVVLVLVGIVVAFLVMRPEVGFLGAWFFLALGPTSSIVPIATEVGAERRMYLPLVPVVTFVVLAVVAGIRRVSRPGDEQDGLELRPGGRVPGGAAALALAAVVLAMAWADLIRTREYASPLRMAETIVTRWPNGRGHYLLGTALVEAGREEEAIRELRASATDYPGAFFALGTELLGTGAIDDGIVQLQAFVQRLPAHVNVIPAREMLARAYAGTGRSDQAAEQLELLVHAAPRHLVARTLLGSLRLQQGRSDEAITQFTAASEIDPTAVDAIQGLGIAYATANRMTEAVAVLRRGVAQAGENARIHTLLGRALAAQGDLVAAASELERALQLDPRSAEARANLDQVRRAMVDSPH